MNFYIADTHFGHDNIRRLSKRPFKTIEEMDKTIIAILIVNNIVNNVASILATLLAYMPFF